MLANDNQIGGQHYNSDFQHWDFIRYLNLPYFPAQVTRYITRWRKKAGIQDLEKALHYMDKYIEVESEKRATQRTLLEEFIHAHRLQEHERLVCNMLVNFNLGDEDRLVEARSLIAELIAILKGEPVAASVSEDPEFLEDGDEWRR